MLEPIIINNRNRLSAKSIVRDAKNKAEQIKKEKILQAKEKFFELKTEHEQEILRKNNEINKSTQRIKQKENSLNQKLSEVNKKDVSLKQTKNDLQIQKSVLDKKQAEIDKIRKSQIEQLEQVSNLSADLAS